MLTDRVKLAWRSLGRLKGLSSHLVHPEAITLMHQEQVESVCTVCVGYVYRDRQILAFKTESWQMLVRYCERWRRHQCNSTKESESAEAKKLSLNDAVRGRPTQLQLIWTCVPYTAVWRTAKIVDIHQICCRFKVALRSRCCWTCFIFSYLACFQAIKLQRPRGEQTGSNRTSPSMNRAVSVTTADLVPPTALVRKCEWWTVHGYTFL